MYITHLTFILLLIIIKLCLTTGTMYDKYFLAEAEIMKKLRHPNIIQLYAVSTQDVLFCIVTELITPGSLLEYLRGKIWHMYQLI